MFGRTVACGVQLLTTEEGENRLIDDGLSTILALMECFKEFRNDGEQKPNGDGWDRRLISILADGFQL